MALEAIICKPGIYRVVLEEYPEGIYVLVYEHPHDADDSPREDYLQDNWEIAKAAAFEDYGITEDQWKQIPDTRFND